MGRIPLLVRTFALALAATAAAPAAAHAWMPEPVQFTRSVAAGNTTRADVRTGRRFDLVGLEWRGARAVHAELRVRLANGRWSRWVHADPEGDGPDPGEGRAPTVGPPVWAGGGSRVQVRLERPVRGLKLRLVNTTGSATAAARKRTRALVERRGDFGVRRVPVTTAGMPAIVPRVSWGASRCKPRDTPSYGDVRAAYVHHTVSVNGYSRARAASLVLAICLFHRNGNGWDDVGYDFLVDRYGQVFEGRGGGIDAPVIGAHAGGFNSESTGVALIGTFERSAPPRAALQSLEQLLAWKLALHGVPALGRVQVTSAGGSSSRYRAGTRVTVNRISGHRDVNFTACPGTATYRRLPALRRAVALRQGPLSGLTLAAPVPPAPYGGGTPVGGRLTVPPGASPDGGLVEVRQLTGGRERVLASALAAPDGSWSAGLPPLTAGMLVRAVFLGDPGRPGVVSSPAFVAVAPRIELSVSPNPVAPGGTAIAAGSVRPSKRRVSVTAYLRRPDGSERRVAARSVPVRGGVFRADLRLAEPGSYRLVARAAADERSLAAESPPAFVDVTP